MKFRTQNSEFRIAFFGAMILICFLMNSCDEKTKNSIGTNEDSICNQSIQSAEYNYKRGKFNLLISGLRDTLGPYAEEILYDKCGKEITVLTHEIFFCGLTSKKERDSLGAGDSCYRNTLNQLLKKQFGDNILERVVVMADSLEQQDPHKYSMPPIDCWREQPQFPGGDSALRKALQKNINYPPAAKKDNITGTVYVRIDLDSMGKVTNAEIVKGVRHDLDSAAIAGVMKLPNFRPLYSGNKKIPSSTVQPIKFTLE